MILYSSILIMFSGVPIDSGFAVGSEGDLNGSRFAVFCSLFVKMGFLNKLPDLTRHGSLTHSKWLGPQHLDCLVILAFQLFKSQQISYY